METQYVVFGSSLHLLISFECHSSFQIEARWIDPRWMLEYFSWISRKGHKQPSILWQLLITASVNGSYTYVWVSGLPCCQLKIFLEVYMLNALHVFPQSTNPLPVLWQVWRLACGERQMKEPEEQQQDSCTCWQSQCKMEIVWFARQWLFFCTEINNLLMFAPTDWQLLKIIETVASVHKPVLKLIP